MHDAQIVNISNSKKPHVGIVGRIAIVALLLLFIFYALLLFLWWKSPLEGIKLHGTVDIGVDLLGTRNDLLWFGGFGTAVFFVNLLLSYFLVKKEKIAAIYLVTASALINVLLIGTVVFLLRLNRIY